MDIFIVLIRHFSVTIVLGQVDVLVGVVGLFVGFLLDLGERGVIGVEYTELELLVVFTGESVEVKGGLDARIVPDD